MNFYRCTYFIRGQKSFSPGFSFYHFCKQRSIIKYYSQSSQSLINNRNSSRRRRYRTQERNAAAKIPAFLLASAFVWSTEKISDEELKEALQDVEEASGKSLVASFHQAEQSESEEVNYILRNSNSTVPRHIEMSWLDYSLDLRSQFEYVGDGEDANETDYLLFMPTYLHRFHNDYRTCVRTLQTQSSYIPTQTEGETSSLEKVQKSRPTDPRIVNQRKVSLRPTDDRKWEKVSEKDKSLQVWRRPCLHLPGINEHLVSGTFEDITARSFFEVQTNLGYRKDWDPDTLLLQVLDTDVDNAQLVRWIVHFPLRMSPREYIFVRRLAVDDSNKILLFLNKATDSDVQSYHLSAFGDVVRVIEYRSTMVVQPHKTFDQPGFDYFLLYYDNPRINVRASLFNWAAASAIPKFMENVHKAALHLEKSGWKFEEMNDNSSATLSHVDLSS